MSQKVFSQRLATAQPTLSLTGQYVNINTPVKVSCNLCKIAFFESPQRLLYRRERSPCPCTPYKLRISPTEYAQKLKKKRPDVELLDEYQGYMTRLRYRSRVCGHVFTAGPDSVLNGRLGLRGCSLCALKGVNIKGSKETFVQALAKKHPGLRLIGEYGGVSVSTNFYCTKDDFEFLSTPGSVLRAKYACVECSRQETGYRFTTVQIGRRTFRIQGYEAHYLRGLKTASPSRFKEIQNGANVPRFHYTDKSPSTKKKTTRTYRPDFLIPSLNMIVEVKSNYTAAGRKEWYQTLKLKRQAVLDAGYQFSLAVFNDKGDRLPVPKNWHKLSRHVFLSSIRAKA